MHRQRILLAALVAAFILSMLLIGPRHQASAQGAAAQKPSPTSYQENVTTTIFDTDATGGQLLMRSDDYNGVSQATYITTMTTGKRPALLVDSEITADGKWYLAMSDQSGRRLWITPNHAIDSSQPWAPPADYYVVQNVYSVCRDQSDNIVPYENLVNGSGNCSLAINFYYGGILYKLLMRPDSLEGTLCPSGGCPATGLAKVNCNAVSNNKCVNWTIAPNADAPHVGVANLYSFTGPHDAAWVFIGQYYNTFRINASYP